MKIVGGKFIPKQQLVNQNGVVIGRLKEIQENNKSVKEVGVGAEVAISIKNATIGRNLKVDDTLYINVPESHVRILNGKFRSELSDEQISLLREFILVMRKSGHHSRFWGA